MPHGCAARFFNAALARSWRTELRLNVSGCSGFHSGSSKRVASRAARGKVSRRRAPATALRIGFAALTRPGAGSTPALFPRHSERRRCGEQDATRRPVRSGMVAEGGEGRLPSAGAALYRSARMSVAFSPRQTSRVAKACCAYADANPIDRSNDLLLT